ncbi:Xaa-Pro peptidase family protein [Brucella abortus]|nr:Xaa-Pro peptidase family protein [Brucella abortus]
MWRSSERFLGALVTPSELIYIVPGFERSRVESLPHLSGEIRGWEEEENSAALIASLLPAGASLAVDDAIPLFAYNPLRQEIAPERLLDGGPLIREQRICKSENEIAIIQYAMNLTLEVHRRAHAMIKPGVAASEVVRFIGEQHRALGARGGSTFCIVSFGAATALPHGADGEQFYQPGDVVLVDTGCRIDGYHSDLTRTYMLMSQARNSRRSGPSNVKRNRLSSMPPGWVCPAPLSMVRARVLVRHGLGPDYKLPGLPHRAGHGLGLEIHEAPYIVRANPLPLTEGMCFSNEPMIVVPEQFGVRLEDHIYMTANGPKWFTLPSKSPVEPFA